MRMPFKYEKAGWVEVLEILYDTQMSPIDSGLDNEHSGAYSPEELETLNTRRVRRMKIKTQSGISSKELKENIEYLREVGLIHENSISLTESGFQLIHQTRMRRQQQKTNFILVILTVVLVILTFLLVGLELL